MKANLLDKIAIILVVIGGLNWGLVGLLQLNLITLILGDITALVRIIYILVGVSTLWVIVRGWKCIFGGCGTGEK
ncbi:DUF378 domain-containing protein [Piscirickettsia litoralis]|uniref:DUF378 domain-containing protein n=1 Tax=Piscirickettsia litoralis TaxID=1891921 RepID=A0ABX3A514_9GAMM|nr:DUF378 domain-containing protein [Piscirickettsia litoralis]ODN43954.1 hypothetical protein BGC07_15010 [Piscirickettsia litoralis]